MTGMQKNWVPVVHENRLWFITGCYNGKQTCIRVDGEKVDASVDCEVPSWSYGEIRGGAVMRSGNSMLRVFHSRTGSPHANFKFRYHLGSCRVEPAPPFKMIGSPKLQYAGNEKYVHGCRHWKPNCVLPYGLVEAWGNPYASVGLNDCESALIRIV